MSFSLFEILKIESRFKKTMLLADSFTETKDRDPIHFSIIYFVTNNLWYPVIEAQ